METSLYQDVSDSSLKHIASSAQIEISNANRSPCYPEAKKMAIDPQQPVASVSKINHPESLIRDPPLTLAAPITLVCTHQTLTQDHQPQTLQSQRPAFRPIIHSAFNHDKI